MCSTPLSSRYLPPGRVLLDGPGRRDVVGGYRVAQLRQDARARDLGEALGCVVRHALEVGRALDVGGVLVPGVAVALGDLQAGPVLVALEHLAVGLAEHVRLHGRLDLGVDLGLRGPDVLEVDVVALAVLAQRLLVEVQVHPPGQRVGHAQRRAGQVVVAHLGVDAPLEVAVSRQHRADRQVAFGDRRGDLVWQRSGVADAGGAAVAHQVEAQGIQRLDQPRALVVVHYHLRARGQRRLDPRLAGQPLLDGVPGQQARAQHDRPGSRCSCTR